MAKTSTLLLTAVIALACGFLGAFGAFAAFSDTLVGPQGPTGLEGPPGPSGQQGAQGLSGLDGADGKDGKAGKSAKAGPVNLGTTNCAGQSVEVVTGIRQNGNKVQAVTGTVCIVGR